MKLGSRHNGRQTIIVPIEGKEIETYFSFFGGGVISSLTWDGYKAVNSEEITGLQVHEGGCFRNDPTPPKIGDMWASIYCGQAGSVYVPFSDILPGKEEEVQKLKIVWIGEYPNGFDYKKDIVIMEMIS